MKQQLAIALVIITTVFGLAGGARAETHRELIVTIPYEFVAAGRTLPAGKYVVSRLSDDRPGALSIVSYEQGAGALVLSTLFESRDGNDTKVSFERVDGMNFLRSIETLDGVYTLTLPRSASLAATRHSVGMSASGTH